MQKEISFILLGRYLDGYWKKNTNFLELADILSLIMMPDWYFDELELLDNMLWDDWCSIVDSKNMSAETFYCSMIEYVKKEADEFKYDYDSLIWYLQNNKQEVIQFWVKEMEPGGEIQKTMTYMILAKYLKHFHQQVNLDVNLKEFLRPFKPYWLPMNYLQTTDKSILKDWYEIINNKPISAENFYGDFLEFLKRRNNDFDFNQIINHVQSNKQEVIDFFNEKYNE